MSTFFDLYHHYRTNLNFKANFVINIDETMINVGHNTKKVLVFHDEPSPVKAEAGKLEHVTLLFAVTAGGLFMKPLAILPLKTLPNDFPISLYNDFDISGNESGWINGEILKNWVENQLVEYATYLRTYYQTDENVLILLDNHSSRNSIDLNFMWNNHRIAFLFLPPHSSHLVQPLDRCPNNEFKRYLQQGLELQGNESAQERRIEVLKQSSIAYKTALSPHYNLKGWKHAGLEPYNPEKILMSGMVNNNNITPEAEEKPAKKRRRPKFNNQIASFGILPTAELLDVQEV
jgi:hypothetical protein